MFKYKNCILLGILLFFLTFSFYPTVYEIRQSPRLKVKNRNFILEHNYYWPDFNLYLSKVRQGYENRWLAVEKYTSEPHRGSLIQIFYLYMGKIGMSLGLQPNIAYQLGRIILSPLLLIVILMLVQYYFRAPLWQILAFVITLVSGSFLKISRIDGTLRLERFMEWWSNIDSLQRITFIPHILFGQVISFYLLFRITLSKNPLKKSRLLIYIILANLVGLVFPPSLITLLGVLILLQIIEFIKNPKPVSQKVNLLLSSPELRFILFSLPSLLYLYITTKIIPWSALVEFHRTHPMMIPFDQYVLGTGPVIFLGFLAGILAIISKEKRFYPMILWVVVTFLFAALFSVVKEQSPLRFTQTGLFIPLGILGTYFMYRLAGVINLNFYRYLIFFLIVLYIGSNLFVMKMSLNWQLSFINQRVGADIPAVPYPPQTMYPLTEWMDAIIWLKNNTGNEDVVLAEITAGNFIPAYSGNFVYFGQSNTVDYNRKGDEVNRFFTAQMTDSQAGIFLRNGRIGYVFFGVQEKEKLGWKNLEEYYPFLKPVFKNNSVVIYRI